MGLYFDSKNRPSGSATSGKGLYFSSARSSGGGDQATAESNAALEQRLTDLGAGEFHPGILGWIERLASTPLGQGIADIVSRPAYAAQGAIEEAAKNGPDVQRMGERIAHEVLSGIGPFKGQKRLLPQMAEEAGVPAGPAISDVIPHLMLDENKARAQGEELITRGAQLGNPGLQLLGALAKGFYKGGPIDITTRGAVTTAGSLVVDPLNAVGPIKPGLSAIRPLTVEGRATLKAVTLSRAGTKAATAAAEEMLPKAARAAGEVSYGALGPEARAVAERSAKSVAERGVKESLSAGMENAAETQKMAASIREATFGSSPAFADMVDREAANILNQPIKRGTPVWDELTRQISDEAIDRTIAAANTGRPEWFHRSGLSFLGYEMPVFGKTAQALRGGMTTALSKATEHAPFIGNLVERGAKARDNIISGLFSVDWKVKSWPEFIAYRDTNNALKAAVLAQNMEPFATSPAVKEWTSLRNTWKRGRKDRLVEMTNAFESGDFSKLTPTERAVVEREAQVYRDLLPVESGYGAGYGAIERYLPRFYDNTEAEMNLIFDHAQVKDYLHARGRRAMGTVGPHGEERIFASSAEAEDFYKWRSKSGKLPEMKIIYDPVQRLVRRLHAHASFVADSEMFDWLSKAGVSKEAMFDIRKSYELASEIPGVPANEIKKINDWLTAPRYEDVNAAREAVKGERARLTHWRELEAERKAIQSGQPPARLTWLNENIPQFEKSIPAPTTSGKYIPKDEIPYYKRRGYTVHQMEDGRWRAVQAPNPDAPAIIAAKEKLAALKSEQADLASAYAAKLRRDLSRTVEIEKDLADWQHVHAVEAEIKAGKYADPRLTETGYKDFMESLSPKGRAEFLRQRFNRISRQAELDGVLEKYSPWLDDMPVATGHSPVPLDDQGRYMSELKFKATEASTYVPQEIAEEVLRSIPPSAGYSEEAYKVVRAFDKMQRGFKIAVYTVWPGAHFRNAYNNQMQMFLKIGVGSLDPRRSVQAVKLLQGGEGRFVTKLGAEYSYADLKDLALRTGAINKGSVYLDNAGSISPLRGKLVGKVEDVTAYIENQGRAHLFLHELYHGSDPVMASKVANDTLFNYQKLTGVEKRLFRRIFPFYTWPKKNLLFQIEMLKNPGRMAVMPKLFSGRESENENMTSWEGDAFKMVLNRDGKSLRVVTGISVPLRSLDQLYPGSWQKQFANLFAMSTPLVRTPYVLASNKDPFTGRDITAIESPAMGALVAKMPKILQQFVGYHERPDNAGRIIRTFDGERFHILFQSWALSRTVSTSDRVFRNIVEDGDVAAAVLDVLTGLRSKTLQLDEEQRKRLNERERYLMHELEKRGEAQRFEKSYIRKGQ